MPTTHRIRRVEFAEVAAKLPSLEPLSPDLVDDGELLICALGFEPRCISVATALAQAGRKFGRCLVLEYQTNRDENELSRQQLMSVLSRVSESVRNVDVDGMDFVDVIRDELRVIIAATTDVPSVIVDISVLANRALFRCMKPLLEANIQLNVLYAEAEIYHPTKEAYQRHKSQWVADATVGLEQGVSDIRVSRDFPGQQPEPLPDCVVVFPSFNSSRTDAVLAKVDPALIANPGKSVVWFVGVPHLPSDRWRTQAMKDINNIDETRAAYEVSTFAYQETFQLLHSLYRERGAQCNITVSPLGSKLQAFGCLLFCICRPDVRVIYSIPSRYNAQQYSDGCKALWRIKLGRVAEFRSLIASIGKIRMEVAEPPVG